MHGEGHLNIDGVNLNIERRAVHIALGAFRLQSHGNPRALLACTGPRVYTQKEAKMKVAVDADYKMEEITLQKLVKLESMVIFR